MQVQHSTNRTVEFYLLTFSHFPGTVQVTYWCKLFLHRIGTVHVYPNVLYLSTAVQKYAYEGCVVQIKSKASVLGENRTIRRTCCISGEREPDESIKTAHISKIDQDLSLIYYHMRLPLVCFYCLLCVFVCVFSIFIFICCVSRRCPLLAKYTGTTLSLVCF